MNNITNATIESDVLSSGIPSYLGFLALVFTVILFGSVFVPVKKFETGDGLFFQLVMCIGIWSVSFVINWVRNFPVYYALPMLGGLLWTTANMITVPVIKCIGLALGLLISSTTSLVVGWASARFGWFGVNPQVPTTPWMNYVGVALAFLSAFFYVFVKPDVRKIDDETVAKNENELTAMNEKTIDEKVKIKDQSDIFSCLNTTTKRILGILMSMYGGSSFAFSYSPILYIIDKYPNSSKNGLDYVFSYYSGILITSVLYFIIYCAIKRNKPLIYQKIILPAFISGCMWGIGNFCLLIASTTLSQAVTFPTGAAGPSMVGIFYSIFIFKEIKGKRNLFLLFAGFTFLVAGAIFSGLSK